MLVYEKTVEGERHLYGTVENSVPSEDDVRLTYKDQDGAEVTPSLDKSYFDDGKGGIKDEEGNAVNVFVEDTMIIPADSEEPIPTKEVVSIEITNMPLITEYEEGEELDLTGLEVTATYDDESTKVVTGYTTNPANGDVLVEGDEVVEVTYMEKTAEFEITVVPVVMVETAEELAKAFAAGGKVRLVADIAMEGNAGLAIAKGSEVELDLNGHELKGTVTENKASQVIANNGSFTINGEGSIVADFAEGVQPGDPAGGHNYATNVIENNGTLIVESGNIINNGNGSACYAIDNNSADGTLPKCYINGGLIKNEFYTPVRVAPTNSNIVELEMTDGLVEGLYGIVFNANSSSAPKLNMAISGGTIKANTYAFYSSAAGNITDASNINIDINGGKFGNGPVVEDELISTADIIGKYISGGEFTSDAIANFVVDECKVADNASADYPWTVVPQN